TSGGGAPRRTGSMPQLTGMQGYWGVPQHHVRAPDETRTRGSRPNAESHAWRPRSFYTVVQGARLVASALPRRRLQHLLHGLGDRGVFERHQVVERCCLERILAEELQDPLRGDRLAARK